MGDLPDRLDPLDPAHDPLLYQPVERRPRLPGTQGQDGRWISRSGFAVGRSPRRSRNTPTMFSVIWR